MGRAWGMRMLSLGMLALLVACAQETAPVSTVGPHLSPSAAARATPTVPAASATPTVPAASATPAVTPTAVSAEAGDGRANSAGALPGLSTVDFPDARSIDVAVTEGGDVYVALGIDEHIFVARSGDGGRSFGDPVRASGGQPALVMGLERPAISATDGGVVRVAWSGLDYRGSIWYAQSADGGNSFDTAMRLSGAPTEETVLPRITLDAAGNPVVAWLAGSTLRLARSADGGASFAPFQELDERTCDCCHPAPLVHGDEMFIAYRNLENVDGRQARDIFFTRSADGGETFGEEVPVSDDHWYLAACPFSGPSLAFDGETLYVSWTDGRNDTQGNLSHTDIWLATSTDNGRTFSPDRRISSGEGVYNNLPSLALDEGGRLHVIWEAREGEREVIYYARSADGGETVSDPVALVSSEDGSGRARPGNASLALAADGESFYVTWVDTLGAHLGAWPLD